MYSMLALYASTNRFLIVWNLNIATNLVHGGIYTCICMHACMRVSKYQIYISLATYISYNALAAHPRRLFPPSKTTKADLSAMSPKMLIPMPELLCRPPKHVLPVLSVGA